ncbi:hypothetical protein H8356DRAFT_1359259 [Neocallimastix lanati (nom. inval.)]|nr:hypothetical protein H8356DRAFT_1359259 [Neocallimastix sp. JGI-2020a]
MSPPYINISVCLIVILYRSTLLDPQRKTEPTIGHLLAIPEELETVILFDIGGSRFIDLWYDKPTT